MNNKKINPDKIELGIGDALLALDIQNDFLPGGRLAVPEGDQVIPVMNNYIRSLYPAPIACICNP
jgi:nicotinamidase/pyrazinamidase